MFKSLYSRIVCTFIGVVIISLVVAFSFTTSVYRNDIAFEDEIIKGSKILAEIVELTEEELIENLMVTIANIDIYTTLYRADRPNEPIGENLFPIDIETVEQVLSSPHAEPILVDLNFQGIHRVVGIPVTANGKNYALFVQLDFDKEAANINRMISTALFVVLFVGSILILLASTYIVNPIKNLTIAANEMAKGNFSVRLNKKSNGEVGKLIESFNHMASEVEKIDKMRDDFVSDVSHEIQSPLTSIQGFTKAIRDEVVSPKNQKEYLDIIYQETTRLSRLGDNLLRLASLDSEHHPFNPSKYRLDEQLRRSVLALEPLWMEKHLSVDLELEESNVYLDQDLFDQVWLNLLTNAIKYSDENAKIIVVLKNSQKQVEVSITDYGKGIPEEAIPKLFDRFYIVDRARNRSNSGNGLGLSIVKKILMIHKSSIKVKSKVGEGSTFTIKIPIIKNK